MPDIGATTRQIDGLLRDEGFLGLSNNSHLHQVSALLQQLHGNELNSVLDRLGDPDLSRLGTQLDAGGIFGAQGLTPDERQDLFNDLARNGDGQHLATLSCNFGRDDAQALAQSLARFATPATKLGYIKGLAARATQQNDDEQVGIGVTRVTEGSPAANSIATVLGSLHGNTLQTALQGLSDPALQAVMRAGARPTLTTTSLGDNAATTTIGYDTKSLTAIVDATAGTQNVQQKARVFETSGRILNEIHDSNTMFVPDVTATEQSRQLAGAMTNLMNSNTTGVVDQLNTDDATGQAAIAYTRELTREGASGQQQLGQVIARLRQGNHLRADATTYLNHYEGDHFYRHAENLGYFTGAIEEGLLRDSKDIDANTDIIRNIFGTAASAGRTFGPTPVKVAIPIVNGLTQQAITAITDGIQGDIARQRAAFYQLALGQDSQHHRYRGPAEPFFATGIVNVAGPAAQVP